MSHGVGVKVKFNILTKLYFHYGSKILFRPRMCVKLNGQLLCSYVSMQHTLK